MPCIVSGICKVCGMHPPVEEAGFVNKINSRPCGVIDMIQEERYQRIPLSNYPSVIKKLYLYVFDIKLYNKM